MNIISGRHVAFPAKGATENACQGGGRKPCKPDIPNASSGELSDALELLGGTVPPGRKAVVIGAGRIGCEVAWYLAEKGKKVTVVARRSDFATDTAPVNKIELVEVFEKLDIQVLTSTTCTAITEQGIEVTRDGATEVITADFVVAATRSEPDTTLFEALEGRVPELYAIGDCNGGTRIYNATHDAGRVARMI